MIPTTSRENGYTFYQRKENRFLTWACVGSTVRSENKINVMVVVASKSTPVGLIVPFSVLLPNPACAVGHVKTHFRAPPFL